MGLEEAAQDQVEEVGLEEEADQDQVEEVVPDLEEDPQVAQVVLL